MDQTRTVAARFVCSGVLTLLLVTAANGVLCAQTSPNAELPAQPAAQPPVQRAPNSGFRLIPLPPQPPLTRGQLVLIALETRFAEDVAQHGGKAFASWFEDDAVALSNGQPAVRGRAGVAASATWDPKDYTLTWVAQGAEMGPSNDMGYTWGRYEGRSKRENGRVNVTAGRYITVWKKQAGGQWKVALDASADLPPGAGSGLPTSLSAPTLPAQGRSPQ